MIPELLRILVLLVAALGADEPPPLEAPTPSVALETPAPPTSLPGAPAPSTPNPTPEVHNDGGAPVATPAEPAGVVTPAPSGSSPRPPVELLEPGTVVVDDESGVWVIPDGLRDSNPDRDGDGAPSPGREPYESRATLEIGDDPAGTLTVTEVTP